MEIVTYRELEAKDDLMMLMDVAFWWPITPKAMEERISLDVRLRDSPVGFCAVEDGRLAGYVGVMDIPTRTISGETELVGGIWAVATNPGLARRGICRTLMEKAHDHFRSREYRFSFLCTGRTIIAYAIYRKMGYEEVESVNQLKAAYKVLSQPGSRMKHTPLYLDPEKTYRLYEKSTQGKTGFVVRQRDFVTMYAARKRFDEKKSILKSDGYALLLESENVIKVRDMAALDLNTYGELIDETEQLAQKGVINGSIADEALVDLYHSKGYRIQTGHNGVVMAKKLTDVRANEVYGGHFYLAPLDWF
jgi:predicted acetyltransferase